MFVLNCNQKKLDDFEKLSQQEKNKHYININKWLIKNEEKELEHFKKRKSLRIVKHIEHKIKQLKEGIIEYQIENNSLNISKGGDSCKCDRCITWLEKTY